MKINRCSVCQNICVPGIDGRCDDCTDYKEPPTCVDCGDRLSKTEIENDEDTCYPCQKGNR